MPSIQHIVPCLWFDGQAEAAAQFYTGIFKNSRILGVHRYTETFAAARAAVVQHAPCPRRPLARR